MSSKSITFAVYGDTHIGKFATQKQLEDAFDEINRMHPQLSLLVHLGDITNSGQSEELNAYLAAREKLAVKTVEILGNHDRPLLDHHAELVWKKLGDISFAREIKGWGLCGITDDQSEDAWRDMFSNLEDMARAGRRLAFVHHLPKLEFIEDASDAGVRAIFYAHRHCTRIQNIEGVDIIGTPAALFGGIDNSPAAIRLIHCKGSRIWTELRPTGMAPLFHCQTAVLRPEGGGQIEIVAYDPINPIRKVQGIVGEGRNKMTMPLKTHGPWSFMVRLPTGLKKPEALEITAERDGAPALELTTRLQEQAVVDPVIGDDWHHPRKTLNGNAYFKSTRIGKPTLLWAAQTPGMAPGGGGSSPIIASGKLFVGVSDLASNSNNGMVALSLKNGRFLWKSDTEGQVRGAASYGTLIGSEGVIVFNDILGKLHCISAEDGSRKWHYQYQSVEGWIHTSPVVEQGRVYAGSAGDLICLSLGSGQKVWRAKRLGKDWMVSLSSCVLDDERLYIGLMKYGLIALNKRNGRLQWKIDTDQYGCVYGPVVCHDGIVYAGTDKGYALAADAEKGTIIWHMHISGSAINTAPVTNGEKLVFGTLSGSAVCLNAKKGDIIWQVKTEPGLIRNASYRHTQPSISSSPILTGDIVHVASQDGKLRGFSLEDGRTAYSVNCGGPVGAGLCLSGNALFLTTYDGRVQCRTFSDKIEKPTAPSRSADKKTPAKEKKKQSKPRPIRKRGHTRKK